MAAVAHPLPGVGLVVHPHPSRDLTLQRYFLLQEQHDFLRRHLDELRPMHAINTGCGPASSPPRGSISLATCSSSASSSLPPRRHTRSHYRRSSMPLNKHAPTTYTSGTSFVSNLETVPDESAAAQSPSSEDDDARLWQVNEDIKLALTELLNCETVRRDCSFRTWVQSRLMEVERELRSGRRTRRSG